MGILKTSTETIHKFTAPLEGKDGLTENFLCINIGINGTDFCKTVKRPESEIGRPLLIDAASDNFSHSTIQDMIQEARLALKADIDKANAWLEGAA